MTDNKEKIHIIATGGTIDKVYSPSQQDNVFKPESGLPEFFKERIDYDVTGCFTKLMMIDSLDMTDDHRKKIVETINAVKEKRILITHGTDTMIETALYIKDNLEDKNKTIILVGSMIPMDGFYYSDAGFNLGYAMACTQHSEAGVYICMNGQKFSPESVVKNIEESRFEEKAA